MSTGECPFAINDKVTCSVSTDVTGATIVSNNGIFVVSEINDNQEEETILIIPYEDGAIYGYYVKWTDCATYESPFKSGQYIKINGESPKDVFGADIDISRNAFTIVEVNDMNQELTVVPYTGNSSVYQITMDMASIIDNPSEEVGIKVGDKVRCNAQYWSNGVRVASFVKDNIYDVIRIDSSDWIVIGVGSSVTGPTSEKYLTIVGNNETSPDEVLDGKFKVGDKVTCSAYYDWNGTRLAPFVRTTVYDVLAVGGKNLSPDRIVIGIADNPENNRVTAAVHSKYLTLVSDKATDIPKDTVPEVEPAAPDPSLYGNPFGDDPLQGMLDEAYSNIGKDKNTIGLDPNENRGVQFIDYPDGDHDKAPIPDSTSEDWKNRMKELKQFEQELNTWNESLFAGAADKNIHYPKDSAGNYWITQKTFGNSELLKFPKLKTSSMSSSFSDYYKYDFYQDPNSDLMHFQNLVNDKKDVLYDLPLVEMASNIDMLVGSRFDVSNKLSRQSNVRNKLFERNTTLYNRYKVENLNDQLSKTFSHVFFVRPDCNIFDSSSIINWNEPDTVKLAQGLNNLSEFVYTKKHSPEILRQLTQADSGYSDQFMMLLSNKAKSFELSDEYIKSDEYGTALTGYKIPYGKHNVESKTADKVTISYIDDRDLHIYNLHKMWTDYISYVYRGKIWPKEEYILNKILDYATCLYYIVCAEDGETIIFWAKYWGVFPLDAPSTAFSWSSDTPGGIKTPEIRVQYQYAWKEDYNPLSLLEFNQHSASTMDDGKFTYSPIFQESKLGVGYTWVRAPFIETFRGDKYGVPYTFKLRFRPYQNKFLNR